MDKEKIEENNIPPEEVSNSTPPEETVSGAISLGIDLFITGKTPVGFAFVENGTIFPRSGILVKVLFSLSKFLTLRKQDI